MKGAALLLAWALAAAVASPASPPVPPIPPVGGGAVVEEVAPGGAAAKAGLAPGDLLLGWERAAAAPANPRPAAGRIGSPFDLLEAEIEEAPRGAFRLTGRRGGKARTWEMPQGTWRLVATPRFAGAALRRYRRGREEIAAGRSAAGIARWRRLAAALARGGAREQATWLWGRIVEAEVKQGAWEKAQADSEQALATPGARRSLPARSKLRWDLARALVQGGRFSAAAGLLERAAEERRARDGESLYVAQLQVSLGEAWARSGELRRADAVLSAALALCRRLAPESPAEGRALTDLGIVKRHRGDFAAAEELQRRSLKLDERLAPGSSEMATDLLNLGNLEADRGDFAAGIASFRQAIDLEQRLVPDSLKVANLLYSLGRALLQADAPAEAEAAFRRSLAILDRHQEAQGDRPDHLIGLGTALWAQHRATEAERPLREALAIHERDDPGSLDFAAALNNLADVLLDEGRLAEAEADCRRALALFRERAPGTEPEATCYRDLALVVRREGKLQEAGELYRSALASVETSGRGAGTARSAFLARFASYYREAVDLLVEIGRPEEAFAVLERYRAQGFLALLAERDLVLDGVPPELERERREVNARYDGLLRQLAGLPPGSPRQASEEIERQLAALRLEQDGLRTRIRATSPRLASLRDPEALDLQATEQALDPGTLLLSFSVGRERSFLFVVGPEPGRFAVHPIPLGEEALRAEVGRLRERIAEVGAEAKPEAVLRQAASLTEGLLHPAAREIAAARRLLVLPDGPLHLLPFALLGDPGATAAGPRFLVEAKPVFTAASATVFAGLQKSRRDRGAVRLSAFGDPAYPARAGAAAEPALRGALRYGLHLAPLPATRTEVLALRDLFPAGTQVFLGSEATEERAKALGTGPSIVHFACHAFVDERSPLDSGLVLSLPESPREGQDNGVLQAWEVFEQVRLDADLVTLSACESGLGQEQGGEGLSGLTRAFQYAGARSVVASLWGVGDEGTAELMRRFYGHLKAGESKDEALRHAQTDLLKGAAGAAWRLPFHWAAFELFGDWR